MQIYLLDCCLQGAKGTNITIDVICGIMTDKSVGDEVDRYAAVNEVILKTYSQPCLDFKYSKMIDGLRQTDWNSSASEGGKISRQVFMTSR